MKLESLDKSWWVELTDDIFEMSIDISFIFQKVKYCATQKKEKEDKYFKKLSTTGKTHTLYKSE